MCFISHASPKLTSPILQTNCTHQADTDSALNQSLSIASYASTHSLASLNPAHKGRQFLASLRGLAPSPSPSATSSHSIPVPEQRRLLHRGES